uniref:F-box/LRR-repeat protein 15-like leucin rich repeat domain-containing protein n=1 Tax=Aegilops tauschii TaxID=37682 RepID=M8CBW5_AEGTA
MGGRAAVPGTFWSSSLVSGATSTSAEGRRYSDREAAALAAASGLRELNLEKCLGVTDMGLAKVAVGCPRLENLSFKWCREISDIGVDLLVKKCRELRSLDISYLKIRLDSFYGVHSLYLGAIYNCILVNNNKAFCPKQFGVSNESLRSISTLEKLEELAMVACSCIDDEGLELLSRGSNSLQGYSCILSCLPSPEIIWLTLSSNMSVDVSRCDHVTSQGLASLIDGHSFLQKLYAADSLHEIGQDFLSKLVTLKATLAVLRLDGFEVSSSLLSAIGEGCTNLVEIGLSKCNGVTDEGISSLVACCSYLRTIDLTCCNLVTNNSLDSIADNCKLLECLRLESCSSINEKGLERIASCCPNLKEIDLTDCGVNDEGIGISSVVTGCKSLVELDLKRCYSVDDSGLWALARYALNLRQLTISYCQVTGLGLCHLLSSLRCLQDVKMVHLSWVSIEGFEMALRAACGRLKKLKILSGLKTVLSPDLLQLLQACGCRIRWVNKPLVYKDAI